MSQNRRLLPGAERFICFAFLLLLGMPRRRRGKTSISCLFLNTHGLKSALLDTSLTDQLNHSILFFSETWLSCPSQSPSRTNFDFFNVPATKPPGRGRPSGGLQLYVHPRFKAQLVSSDEMHICVSLPHLTVAGFYFKPGTDFDDLILCISSVLNHSPNNIPIILGGDFNLKPDSTAFRELCLFLRRAGVSLVSDQSVSTYLYSKGSSCIDYIFATQDLPIPFVNVLDSSCSDHLPLQAKVLLPRVLNFKTSSSPPNSKIDIETAAEQLSALDPSSASEDLICDIDKIFFSCATRVRKKSSRPWFSSECYSLRTKCKELRRLSKQDSSYLQEYVICRKAYHHLIKRCKKQFDIATRDKLVNDSLCRGLPALFRSAKKRSDGSCIPLAELFQYSKKLYSVDAASEQNEFVPLPSCDVESHELLEPFTALEIEQCLSCLKSKAPSAFGSHSPLTLKLLSSTISPLLLTIFNQALSSGTFPITWLESVLFFLHKKGSKTEPSNYRTIAVQNPFLKVFMTLLCTRMSSFAETKGLLPDLQFGFREFRSCPSAVSLLFHTASSRLSEKKRTYVAFIDFTKAFDKVNRTLLFTKLQQLGFPRHLCELIFYLLSNLQFRVRQDKLLSPPFHTEIGTPQGDPLSPLLFSLFLSDLPDIFTDPSVSVPGSNTPLPCILFADDTSLIADSAESLQRSLDLLSTYCDANFLPVNTKKSKILVFHKGRLPPCDFHYKSAALERVNVFQYLGVHLSSQLSFSHHISSCVSKAHSRIGFLNKALPLKNLPLKTILQVFQCFIFPIFSYCAHIWLTSLSNNASCSLNAVFTKFLKRYLCLPLFTNNAITHFLTSTTPLLESIKHFCHSHALPGSFPRSLSGTSLDFLSSLPRPSQAPVFSTVPSEFWFSPVISVLPLKAEARRSLLHPLVSPFFPDFARS